MHEILTRLGGVRPEDATLLIGGTASQLLGAVVAVEMQAAEAKKRGERTALLFYYSGHAKDGSLRLGETRVPIDGIKARIASSPRTTPAVTQRPRAGQDRQSADRRSGSRRRPAAAA